MRLLSCLVVGCFSVGELFADERVNLGDFLISRSPAVAPSTSLGYMASSEVDFDSAAGGFSYEQAKLDLPLTAPIYLNDRHAFLFGVRYEATWLDTDTFLGDESLYDFRLNVRWIYRQPGSKWSWTARVSPGVATDGENVSGDDFVVSGQVGFRYRQSDRLAWLGGVVFSADPLETRVFPAIGFQWIPSDDWIVRLTGPSLRVSWQPCDSWLFHASAELAGGAWNVEQAGGSFDVRVDSVQVGVGVEHEVAEKVWLGIWAGATLANDLEIETASGNGVFDQDADAGWFVRLGLRKVLW